MKQLRAGALQNSIRQIPTNSAQESRLWPEPMIQTSFDKSDTIAILELDTKLTKADFKQVNATINKHLNSNGILAGIIVYTQTFSEWDTFEALLDRLKFINDHHKWTKYVALVSDSEVIGFPESVISHFVHAETHAFPYSNIADARRWILDEKNCT